MTRFSTQEEPTPEGSGPAIVELVKEDLEARAREGERKYGERLRANNGRDALVDAYQEALDLCQYLRQRLEEKSEEEKQLQLAGDIQKKKMRASGKDWEDLKQKKMKEWRRESMKRTQLLPWIKPSSRTEGKPKGGAIYEWEHEEGKSEFWMRIWDHLGRPVMIDFFPEGREWRIKRPRDLIGQPGVSYKGQLCESAYEVYEKMWKEKVKQSEISEKIEIW